MARFLFLFAVLMMKELGPKRDMMMHLPMREANELLLEVAWHRHYSRTKRIRRRHVILLT